jgi:hypothetical protein
MSTGFDKSFREELEVARRNAGGGHPWVLAAKSVNRYKLLAAYRLMSFLR